MSEFVDESGRKWSLRVDVAAIRKVRSKRGVDLAKVMGSQEELQKLLDDPCLWVDVIWDLIEEQATTQGVDPESFAHGLAGDSFEAANNALIESIIDFFPSGRREILRRLLSKVKEMESLNLEKVTQQVDSLMSGS
jgi:hypothetical protein